MDPSRDLYQEVQEDDAQNDEGERFEGRGDNVGVIGDPEGEEEVADDPGEQQGTGQSRA